MPPTPAVDRPLRSTSWAVLGLLSFGSELSGYDLKKWADWSLRFFYWAPSFSQIYAELRKLEDLGYTTSRELDPAGGRGTRLYAITPSGVAAISHWLADGPADPVVLKHAVMLRMWLGHLTDPDQLRRTLAEHRDLSEKMRAKAKQDAEGAAREPGWAYPELVLRWSQDYYAAERDRAERMIADLDRLAIARSGRAAATADSPRPLSSGELRAHES